MARLLGDKPLYLEIGCGKGQFISQMAQLHPENAYLGIETQRDVCYYAVKKLRDQEIDNARILRLMRPICLTGSKKGKWKALPQLQRSLAQGSSCKTTPYLPQFPCSL